MLSSISTRVIKLKFISFISSHIKDYPTPQNLNYFWSFGSLLGLCLVIQIISGVFLSMHYTPNTLSAFFSVEHIMRDVQYGYVFRYAHANGASMLFILLYLHIFRGLYYESFKANVLLWWSGVLLFLLMMGTAFLGYVLPWGQMSLWGATVITNLASAIPFVGQSIVEWLWGGFSVDNATLNRFYSFHYVLPFAILAVVILHLALLHSVGSTNPLTLKTKFAKIKFYPYFYVKDLFAFLIFICVFIFFVFFIPNYLGHPDNYITGNPMVTPEHIVPEWYFLPFYAILRSIPNKLFGVIAMLMSIISLGLLTFKNKNNEGSELTFESSIQQITYPLLVFLFMGVMLILGWIGQKPAIEPYILIGQIATMGYFFLILLLYIDSTSYKLVTTLNIVTKPKQARGGRFFSTSNETALNQFWVKNKAFKIQHVFFVVVPNGTLALLHAFDYCVKIENDVFFIGVENFRFTSLNNLQDDTEVYDGILNKDVLILDSASADENTANFYTKVKQLYTQAQLRDEGKKRISFMVLETLKRLKPAKQSLFIPGETLLVKSTKKRGLRFFCTSTPDDTDSTATCFYADTIPNKGVASYTTIKNFHTLFALNQAFEIRKITFSVTGNYTSGYEIFFLSRKFSVCKETTELVYCADSKDLYFLNGSEFAATGLYKRGAKKYFTDFDRVRIEPKKSENEDELFWNFIFQIVQDSPQIPNYIYTALWVRYLPF